MHIPENPSDYITIVSNLTDAEDKSELIEESLTATETWDVDRCVSWLGVLCPWLEQGVAGDGKPSFWGDSPLDQESKVDLEQGMLDLVQRLVDQVSELGEARQLPISLMRQLIEDMAVDNYVFGRLPRRGLVDLYIEWLEVHHTPTVMAYREHVKEVASPRERLRIAEQCASMADRHSSAEPDEILPWLMVGLRTSVAIAPGSVQRFISVIEKLQVEDHAHSAAYEMPGLTTDHLEDVAIDAEVARHKAWLADATDSMVDDLPPSVCEALAYRGAPSQRLEGIELALQDLASEVDMLRVPSHLLREALCREGELLKPSRLRVFPPNSVCPEALEWLKIYERERKFLESMHFALCTPLVFAVEAQARHAISSELHDATALQVRSAGLAALSRLLAENLGDEDDPELRRCQVDLSQLGEQRAVFLRELRRASDIRNCLHHPKRSLTSRDAHQLDEFIFAPKSIETSLLVRFSSVRVSERC